MYYANQDNSYMQDLNFYNQMNPNVQNLANSNQFGFPMQFNNQNYPFGQCQQPFPNMNFQSNINSNMNQNIQANNALENMYPSIYRIINPVVERVIDGTGNRNQIVNEDNLNNMVDTVFNIVDGQVEREDSQNQLSSVSDSRTTTQNSNSSRISNERNEQVTQLKDRNNSLLKDLIRILIIKSLLSRNNRNTNFQNVPNNISYMNYRTNF